MDVEEIDMLKTLDDNELWSCGKFDIPQRSTLFNIQPVGLRTASVESLISYVMRLSNEHCLHPSDLMFQMVFPLFKNGETICKHKAFSNKIETLNGFRSRAKELVDSLETLSLRQDLKFLTLLPLSELFSGTNEKVFHTRRTWCSSCLEEFRSSGTTVYEKLIWSFRQVEICLEHQEFLSHKCPHCDSEMASLMGHSRAGYCSRCQKWLGISKSLKVKKCDEREPDLLWKMYAADNIGRLIACSFQLELSLTQVNVTSAISDCINQISGGNKEAFCRLVGIPRKALTERLRNSTPPNFSRILLICYRLQVPILDFLTGKFDNSTLCLSEELREKVQIKSRKRSNSHNQVGRESLRQLLVAALEEVPPPTLDSVVERSGYVRNTAIKYFPDLCSQIRHRYFQGKLTSIKFILDAALEETPPPPLIKVVKRLGYSSKKSIFEHFPSECVQIVERHKVYCKNLVKQRQEQECLFIQEIADHLRSQGEAVTRSAIVKLGLKPVSIRKKHVQNKLKEVLDKWA
ncbi:TniQ family protein [Leptolyngbya sp. AN03gr2]|uniref:TniQ family protein n=1 Tax=unclassified Leptolyngbya TaxID=2650499 RepID=UPI003D3208D5